jgi:hypothetical protein
MMGKKNPKKADTAGGKTPETNAKELGEAVDHCAKKLTYADICGERVTGRPHTTDRQGGTHRGQVGKNGDDEEWDGIEETDQEQQQETDRLVSEQLCSRFIQILPDLRVTTAWSEVRRGRVQR